jgi:hypothetical protein
MLWKWFGRLEVFLVGRDPVAGNVALRCSQINLALPNHAVEMVFESILDVSVPDSASITEKED